MNKQPSQRITAVLCQHRAGEIPLSDLPEIFEVMAEKLQKEEAEAYRSWQGVFKYYGVEVINKLIEKSNKLTGIGAISCAKIYIAAQTLRTPS